MNEKAIKISLLSTAIIGIFIFILYLSDKKKKENPPSTDLNNIPKNYLDKLNFNNGGASIPTTQQVEQQTPPVDNNKFGLKIGHNKDDIVYAINTFWSDLFGMDWRPTRSGIPKDYWSNYDLYRDRNNGWTYKQQNENFTEQQKQEIHNYIDKIYSTDSKGVPFVVDGENPLWYNNATAAFQKVFQVWVDDTFDYLKDNQYISGLQSDLTSSINGTAKKNDDGKFRELADHALDTSYVHRMFDVESQYRTAAASERSRNAVIVKTAAKVISFLV